MKNDNWSDRDIIFIQAPPQERGYEVCEEEEFYEKYWSVYCKNLETQRVSYPVWEMPIWAPLIGGILEAEGIESKFLDLSFFCGKQSYYSGEYS